MKQVNQQKLLKQIDRFNISITFSDGQKVYNAADLFTKCLLTISKQTDVKNITYYKK